MLAKRSWFWLFQPTRLHHTMADRDYNVRGRNSNSLSQAEDYRVGGNKGIEHSTDKLLNNRCHSEIWHV